MIRNIVNLIKHTNRSFLITGSRFSQQRLIVRSMADEVEKAQTAQAAGETIFSKIINRSIPCEVIDAYLFFNSSFLHLLL